MKAIYETRGRAREYCELAINLYTGCEHRCIYCYGADVTHQDKKAFEYEVKPRTGILDAIWRDARYYRRIGEVRPILMCFVTDPYQPLEAKGLITRQAIEILHDYKLRVAILTKAGQLAQRDFDLLGSSDAFATTLTLIDDGEPNIWEPNAGKTAERIANLQVAHNRGIGTWVSCEPVIYPAQTLALIEQTHKFVDMFKVGTMNYHPHGKTINWHKFARDVKALLDGLGCKYYLKKDLERYLDG